MKKFQIICIDDQREVLAAVQRDLAFFEDVCEINECESAAEAEELLEEFYAEEKPVMVIICDHIMPGENGVDFLARLKEDDRFSNIFTILLTGLATHKDTIDAINKAKINHYIEKPWQKEDLLKKIKMLFTLFILQKGYNFHDYKKYIDQDILLKHMHKQG